MPRVARTVVPGVPHHVTQRGNNRQDVFFADDDRRVYLAMLKRRSGAYGLRMIGHCLMTNHMRLIAVPATEDALARAVWRTHCFQTQHANRFPHACDNASGSRQDTNGNGVPGEYEQHAAGGGQAPAPGGDGGPISGDRAAL
ncbi:MAG: transposase [Phycisphaerae bacterium]